MQIELRSPQKERVRERGRAAIEVENHVECREEGCAGDGIGGGGEDAGGGSVLPNDGTPTAESACEQILHAADCIDPWLLPSSSCHLIFSGAPTMVKLSVQVLQQPTMKLFTGSVISSFFPLEMLESHLFKR